MLVKQKEEEVQRKVVVRLEEKKIHVTGGLRYVFLIVSQSKLENFVAIKLGPVHRVYACASLWNSVMQMVTPQSMCSKCSATMQVNAIT